MGKIVCVVLGGSDVTRPDVEYVKHYKNLYRVFDSEEKADKYIRDRMTGMYDGFKQRNARMGEVHFMSTYPVSGTYAYIDEFQDDKTIRHYYEWIYKLIE